MEDQLPRLITNNKKLKTFARDGAAAAEGETQERCATELRPWLTASTGCVEREEVGPAPRCALNRQAGERLSLRREAAEVERPDRQRASEVTNEKQTEDD